MYQKYINKNTFASFEGQKMLANVTCFSKCVFEDVLAHKFWPPQTAFELKIALPAATNQPDATALTDNAINLLNKTQKTSKYLSENLQIF